MFLEETLEIVTEKEINLIANEIIRRRLGNKDYLPPNHPEWQGWFFTVSPKGKIIYPLKHILKWGHLGQAEEQIYPEDNILSMLAKWYYNVDKIYEIPIQEKSYFMIFYGYISIDGYWDGNMTRGIKVKYNSLAVNDLEISNVRVPSNQNILSNSYGEKSEGKEQIDLSQIIVFLKRNILNKLRAYNLTEQEIPKLLEKLKKTEKEFLDELAIEYERQKEIELKDRKSK